VYQASLPSGDPDGPDGKFHGSGGYFVDRKTDSIRRRGENIRSMEAENEINSHPQGFGCAAFSLWAEESEQEVMETIVPKPGRRPRARSRSSRCTRRASRSRAGIGSRLESRSCADLGKYL